MRMELEKPEWKLLKEMVLLMSGKYRDGKIIKELILNKYLKKLCREFILHSFLN